MKIPLTSPARFGFKSKRSSNKSKHKENIINDNTSSSRASNEGKETPITVKSARQTGSSSGKSKTQKISIPTLSSSTTPPKETVMTVALTEHEEPVSSPLSQVSPSASVPVKEVFAVVSEEEPYNCESIPSDAFPTNAFPTDALPTDGYIDDRIHEASPEVNSVGDSQKPQNSPNKPISVGTIDRLPSSLTQPKFSKQQDKSIASEDLSTTEKSSTLSMGSISSYDISSLCSTSSHPPPTTSTLPKNPHPYAKKFRPKIKKEDVQATNDGYASVKKLSEWLDHDPFEKKKPRPTRKQSNILRKSRVFEPDQPSPVAKELEGVRGSVKEKKDWLKGAFEKKKEEEEDDCVVNKVLPFDGERIEEVGEPPVRSSVVDKAKWLKEEAFKAKQAEEGRQKTEKPGKAAVSDRAKWLADEAFKKKQEQKQSAPSVPRKPIEIVKPVEDNNNNTIVDESKKPKDVDIEEPAPAAVSDRAKWLREEAFKKKQAEATNQRVTVDPSLRGSVSDRAKWLKDEAFGKSQTTSRKTPTPTSRSSSPANSTTNSTSSDDRIKPTDTNVKDVSGEEALKKKQVEATNQRVTVDPSLRGSVSDRAKWLKDEAFGKSQTTSRKTPTPTSRSSSPANSTTNSTSSDDRIKCTDTNVKDVIGTLNKSTKTNKPKTAVQLRREELERKEKEKVVKGSKKISWVSENGTYAKKVEAETKIAPRKSIMDLP